MSTGELWRIGDPDGGPRQFSTLWFTPAARGREPTLVVGEGNAAVDFPQVHPGPLDAVAGFHPATATVMFDGCTEAAAAWHALALDAVATHGPCPDLLVGLGERHGRAVLEPERRDRAPYPFPPSPIAGVARRVLALPPGTVQPGRNALRLTTVSAETPDPDELRPPQLPPLARWFGSALSWRCVSLHRGAAVSPTVHLRATPFCRTVNGELRTRVDAVVRDAPPAATLAVAVAGERVLVALPGQDFGDHRVAVWVPAFSGEVEATATLLVDRQESRRWSQRLRAARRWTLHLIPHSHLDVGYTDLQGKVLELHHRNVDRALDLIAEDPAFRYTVDGSLVLDGYGRSRSPARRAALTEALAAGRIDVNAFRVLFLSGITALETVYRSADRSVAGPGGAVAWLTDVPSYTQAMPSLLAALGIDGFVGIQNHFRGGNVDSDELHLHAPVRWVGPDGAGVLAHFADGYAQLRSLAAEPPTVAGATDGFARYLARYERPEYLPHDLPIVGTHNDNEDLAHGYRDFVARWNARYTWPRLVLSTMAGYLAAVRPLADRLPEVRGDGGSYWEDGVGADAASTALLSRTQRLLPAAEALAALVAWVHPALVPDVDRLDRAWDHVVLGVEHTWSSAHATLRPHSEQSLAQQGWKRGQIAEGMRRAEDLARQALSQLGDLVTLERPALLVVNPVGWGRDLEVEVELDDGMLVDADPGAAMVDAGPVLDGVRRTAVLVRDVPPFGYRSLRLRRDPQRPSRGDALGAPEGTGEAEDEGPVWTPSPARLVTPHFEVGVDDASGALTHLVHRASGRQLVDGAAAWGIGAVLVVRGGGSAEGRGLGGEATSLWDAAEGLAPPDLDIQPGRGRVLGVRRRPWSTVVAAEGAAPDVGVRWRWSFPDHTDWVDLTVTLDKAPVLAKESVYVAFPFAVTAPVVRYDRQQGWVDPAGDLLPGACGEWFTVDAVVTVTGAEGSLAWSSADAPLFALDDVVRGRWPRAVRPRSGTLLSWVMNNHWSTNTPASQEGRVTLRYRFRPLAAFDRVAAFRLGRSLQVPALAQEVTYNDRGDTAPRALPAAGTLFGLTTADHVELSVLAPRRRAGLLLRLREVGGHDAVVRLPAVAGAATARCRADEEVLAPLEPAADGSWLVPVRAYEVVTVALARPAAGFGDGWSTGQIRGSV